MTIGSNNIQEELNDVNNLWRWPTEYAPSKSRNPNSVFTPVFFKWHAASRNGYINYGRNPDLVCDFTDHSVTSEYHSAYTASTFVDLKPGAYVISFDVDGDCRFSVIPYMKIDAEQVLFALAGGSSPQIKCGKGHNEVQFQVEDKTVVEIWLAPDSDDPEVQATFTNIIIKEGVLS